jgi:uncharacterized protein YxjI
MPLEEDVLDNNTKETEAIKDYVYPLNFQFKVTSLANDFNVKDAEGNTLAYVRQKMFKLKEAISVFSNENRAELLYKINADRIIDFNASYSFTNADEEVIGRIGRKGAKSILKAHYEIFNKDNKQEFVINEENPWAKVGDAVLGEIPIVGMFTGYFCNPRYAIKRADGTIVARLSKEASFMGRKFQLEKLSELNEGEGERMVLAIMMMSLLERRRG